MVFEVRRESFRSTHRPLLQSVFLSLRISPNANLIREIIIGRDTRESGESIERALIEGANKAGVKCLSAGVITTPGVAFLTRKHRASAGVVISASHNPYQDNGIKIFAPSGEKMDDSVERMIEADIFAQTELPSSIDSVTAPSSPELQEKLRQEYLSFLADEIGSDLNLEGLTMVVDCANGASSALAPVLFARLGAKVIAINAAPDGQNINRDCGSLHIDSLRQRVVDERADLGVAFDGDADRSLCSSTTREISSTATPRSGRSRRIFSRTEN